MPTDVKYAKLDTLYLYKVTFNDAQFGTMFALTDQVVTIVRVGVKTYAQVNLMKRLSIQCILAGFC